MAKNVDLTGVRFGRLLVEGFSGFAPSSPGRRKKMWTCLCDCGVRIVKSTNALNRGENRSCGCLHAEIMRRPRRAVIGYEAMHGKVRRARGRASEHGCADCGGQAQEWSYDHNAADEMLGVGCQGSLMKYSMSVDEYEPRCRPCHRRLDRGK